MQEKAATGDVVVDVAYIVIVVEKERSGFLAGRLEDAGSVRDTASGSDHAHYGLMRRLVGPMSVSIAKEWKIEFENHAIGNHDQFASLGDQHRWCRRCGA